jgi:hypothetical protein
MPIARKRVRKAKRGFTIPLRHLTYNSERAKQPAPKRPPSRQRILSLRTPFLYTPSTGSRRSIAASDALARRGQSYQQLSRGLSTFRPRICLRENRIVLIPAYYYFGHLRCVPIGCGYGASGCTVGTGRTKTATLLLPDHTLETVGQFLGSASINVLVPAQETLEPPEMFMTYAVRIRCSVYQLFCQLFPVISPTPNRCGGGSGHPGIKVSPLFHPECRVVHS